MIRVAIVDDEPPARAKLRRMLELEDRIEIVGEAGDGEAAVVLLRETRPDLVFLDVQMPRLDGFGVVRAIGVEQMPFTVFVTAFDQHALAAFEVEALDYLLEPYGGQRFGKVLARARRALAERSSSTLVERLQSLVDTLDPRPGTASSEPVEAASARAPLRRLRVQRGEDREVLLALDTVRIVRADGNYLRFVTADGEYGRRGTLRALEARLDPAEFLRINRSEIVRVDVVEEIQPWFHGDYRVLLDDGTLLSWSRRYRARFDDGL